MASVDSELSVAVSQLRALHSSIQSLLVAKNVPRIMWPRYLPDLSSSVFLNMQLQKVNCQTLYDKLFAYENGQAARDVRFECLVREADQLRFELQALRIKYFKSLMSERQSPEDARKIVLYEDKEMNERIKYNQERQTAVEAKIAQKPAYLARNAVATLNAAVQTSDEQEERRDAVLKLQLKIVRYEAHATCASLISAVRTCFAEVVQQGDAIQRAVQQINEVSASFGQESQQNQEIRSVANYFLARAYTTAGLAADLHSEIASLKQENVALQQKMQHLEQSNFLLSQASAVWKAQAAQLEAYNSQAAAAQRALEQSVQARYLEQQYSGAMLAQLEQLTRALEAQEQKAQAAEAAEAQAVASCRAAGQDREAALEQREALQGRVAAAEREVQALQQQLSAAVASAYHAYDAQAMLQNQLQQAQSGYQAATEAFSTASAAVKQRERHIVDLEQRAAAFQAQVEHFYAETAKNQIERIEAGKTLSSLLQRQGELEQQLERAETRVLDAGAAKEHYVGYIRDLEQQLAAQAQAMCELEGQISVKMADAAKPQKPYRAQRGACSRCKALQMQVEMLQRVLEGGNSDVIEIIEEKGIWERRVDELQAENDCLQRILREANGNSQYSLPVVENV